MDSIWIATGKYIRNSSKDTPWSLSTYTSNQQLVFYEKIFKDLNSFELLKLYIYLKLTLNTKKA